MAPFLGLIELFKHLLYSKPFDCVQIFNWVQTVIDLKLNDYNYIVILEITYVQIKLFNYILQYWSTEPLA